MTWSFFPYFAIASVLLWLFGAISAWRDKSRGAFGFTAAGIALFFTFIVGLWLTMHHPPLRTMGETRLWYSALLPVVGLGVYARWHYRWILSFSTLLAAVFVCVNIFRPELHTQTLMPALQSPWFAPHVIVYMFAYAMMSAATLMAIYYMATQNNQNNQNNQNTQSNQTTPTAPKPTPRPSRTALQLSIDDTVRAGLAFLTFGMLFGALWAKQAWGHYWSWDPKETWAAITWLAYLIYLHYRQMPTHRTLFAHLFLLLCFCLLQMCWWGINYLPAANGSVHTY